MKDTKWQITNTTVKPPLRDPRTGKDMRTITERVGHYVSFVDNTGRKYMLTQHSRTIVSELNQGILNLAQGDFIKVDRIDDIAEVLKSHAARIARAPAAAAASMPILAAPAKTTAVPSAVATAQSVMNENTYTNLDTPETPDVGQPLTNHGSSRRAFATEMGSSSKGSDTTESGAVNPDGEPNFAVIARHDQQGRRKRKNVPTY